MAKVAVAANGGGGVVRDGELYGALRRAHRLQMRMRALDGELSEAKTLIAGRARALAPKGPQAPLGATVSFRAGGVICTVSPRVEALIEERHVGRLRRLLGRRFHEFIKTRHSGSLRLLKNGAAREFLTLKELSPRIRLEETK